MSGVRIPQGRCYRAKVIYLSEGEAQKALDRRREWGRGMEPYYCQFCHAYHVGHPWKKASAS